MLSSLALVLPLLWPAPQDFRPELPLGSSGSGVQITPSGELWLGARDGHLYVSRNSAETWVAAPVPTKKSAITYRFGSRLASGGDDASYLRWFDDERGVLPLDESRTLITSDGGTTWTLAIPTGVPNPVDCQAAPDGRAWILGHRGALVASCDFGSSWEPLEVQVGDDDRITAFALEQDGIALIGTGAGVLISTDAGRSWTLDEISRSPQNNKPREQLVSGGPRAKVTKVRRAGAYLLALHSDFDLPDRYRVLGKRIGGQDPWAPVEVSGERLADFEPYSAGWVVLTRSKRIGLLSADFVLNGRLSEPTRGWSSPGPGDLTTTAETIAVFDGHSHLALLRGGELRHTRLYGTEEAWDLREIDIALDGTWWGTSQWFTYRSDDQGQRWQRVSGERPARGLFVRRDGLPLVGAGAYALDPSDAEFKAVPAFENVYRPKVLRAGDLWLAYGARAEDAEKVMDLIGSTHSTFAADFVDGVLLISTNGGIDWRELHRWPGGAIEDLHLAADGTLYAYRVPGGLLRGTLDLSGESPKLDAEILIQPDWESPIRLDYGRQMFFDGDRGSLEGGNWYGDSFRLETEDGGRTWKRKATDRGDRRCAERFRLRGDRWARRITPPESDPSAGPPGVFELLVDGEWEPLREFDDIVRWARTDAAGRLLVALESGELWSFDKAWDCLTPR